MEIGRGTEEGRTRCQEPAKMIFGHCSRPMPGLHPAHIAFLSGTIMMTTTMHRVLNHLTLLLVFHRGVATN